MEWRDRTLPVVIPRVINIKIDEEEKTRNAHVVTGFRRVGKTYLLFEAIQKLLKKYSKTEVIYLNFEDERLGYPTVEVLTNLIPSIISVFGKKPKYLFLDELQIIPNWSKWVRRILDTEDIKLIITGSSSKMSSSELPTELRGRAWETKVSPLNFNEFLRFKDETLDKEKVKHLDSEKARFDFFFNEYLTYGALPAIVQTPIEKKQELLQLYFNTVTQKEILERYSIENEIALKTLLNLLVNSSYISLSKLSNSLKSLGIPVGKTTLNSYISYIKSSYFMDEVYLHSQSMAKQLVNPRKVFFIDSGMIGALSTKFSNNLGRLLENTIYSKLKFDHKNLHYFKTKTGKEVDFVTRENEIVTGLYQVCYDIDSAETLKREISALKISGKYLKCDNLNLITMNTKAVLDKYKNINFIEVYDFFL